MRRPASAGPFPPVLFGPLSDAYRRLADLSQAPELSVAVRSSATDEDSRAASFAGQHDSYLNVVGEEAVVDAVVRCWPRSTTPTRWSTVASRASPPIR